MSGQDGNEPKKYGLILPKKKNQPEKSVLPVLKKASIFDDDLDEDDGSTGRTTADARAQQAYGNKSLWKKETQVTIQKALAEDPTAFDYDGVFDKIAQQKAENESRISNKESGKDRKPKYMHSLMAAAREREREYDRRLERKVQRERETEGGEFAGKESFVTSAYKKKMEEMREQEAKEKETARVEALLDVTKQKDLTGFYRHLLKQSTGEERVLNAGESRTVTSVPVAPADNLPSSSKRKDTVNEEPDSKRTRNEESEDSDTEAEEHREIPDSQVVADEPVPDIMGEQVSLAKSPVEEDKKNVFAKHSTEDTAKSARERYLARQAAKASQGSM